MSTRRIVLLTALFVTTAQWVDALVVPRPSTTTTPTISTAGINTKILPSNDSSSIHHNIPKMITSTLLATTVFLSSSVGVMPAHAYETTDYASDTVQESLQSLKKSSGNIDETFQTFETIAGIITEGKGVGGMVNYKGIQLERGFVADEDTSIYNPGLTLLTESEKERLVEGIISNRKIGITTGQWNENNEFAYDFLKGRLDPLHMYELSGFLNFVPIYGAILYLTVLAIQQNIRSLFIPAYLVGVVAFFAPILALVAAGPQ